jgi:hypothetical protein
MIDLKSPVTEENIYKLVDELNIFEHYLGEVKINATIRSPFRDEYNPSFSVFSSTRGSNRYLWKDHGIPDSGNVVKLVQKLYALSYKDALNKIAKDLKLDLDISEIAAKSKIELLPPSDRKTFEKEEKVFLVARANWRFEHIQYWKKYGITPKQCEYYNIYPIDYLQINEAVLAFNQYHNPSFCYSFYDEYANRIVYKIYRPYDKVLKWISNAPKYIIQGLDQVKVEGKQSLGFITKSLKDVVVLRKLGYLAIAPQSETTGIPSELMPLVDGLFQDYLYFYDNDTPGIKAATDQAGFYKKNYIYIDPVYNVKDISDFVEKYGYKEAEILLNSLI